MKRYESKLLEMYTYVNIHAGFILLKYVETLCLWKKMFNPAVAIQKCIFIFLRRRNKYK